MSVADLLTLGGLSVAVSLVFQVAKRLWQPTPAMLDRFGPLVAIALGILIGGGAAVLQQADLAQAVVNGVLAGLSAMGLYDLTTSRPVGG